MMFGGFDLSKITTRDRPRSFRLYAGKEGNMHLHVHSEDNIELTMDSVRFEGAGVAIKLSLSDIEYMREVFTLVVREFGGE